MIRLLLVILAVGFVIGAIRIAGVDIRTRRRAHDSTGSEDAARPTGIRASGRLIAALIVMSAAAAVLFALSLRWIGGLLDRLFS